MKLGMNIFGYLMIGFVLFICIKIYNESDMFS